MCSLLVLQCTKLREHIATVRKILENKDTESAENIKKATNELQQASLKLFEMAYKKVSRDLLLSQCNLFSLLTLGSKSCFC